VLLLMWVAGALVLLFCSARALRQRHTHTTPHHSSINSSNTATSCATSCSIVTAVSFMSSHFFPASPSPPPPDSRLPTIEELIRHIRQHQEFRHTARRLSTQSAPASAMGSPYYRGALCLGVRNADIVDAEFVVLSDAQLLRTAPEHDHPCLRCAKSLALGIDCVRGHKTCARCQTFNRGGCQFVSDTFSASVPHS
jgi:hypothetical protein